MQIKLWFKNILDIIKIIYLNIYYLCILLYYFNLNIYIHNIYKYILFYFIIRILQKIYFYQQSYWKLNII